MTILRRIAKYLPAAAMGLLVAAWVGSCLGTYVLFVYCADRGYIAAIAGERGTLVVQIRDDKPAQNSWAWGWNANPGFSLGRGVSWSRGHFLGSDTAILDMPFACLLTLLLPIAFGSLTGFRFRLWHFLTYTTLVAVELAYYLPWRT